MVDKSGLFQKIRKQAKKVGQFGQGDVSKISNESTNKENSNHSVGQVVEGQAYQREPLDLEYQDIKQLFRHQFPTVTRQVFGRRYNTLNKVSRFVLPNGMDQAADEILEFLAEFAISLASTEKVLAETGSKNIHELQQDLGRSQRAGGALKEMNKIIAGIQGGLSGMTGLIGAAADLPFSVILSLKTIYEIGHSYGFELDNEEDQQAVFYALSKSDLSLIAEKQALFLGLRSIQSIFKTGDYHQLQSFLNSNYSFEQFQALLTNADGQYKWNGLKLISKFKVLRYATPLFGGVIGTFYSVKLIDEVATHADEVFSYARQYLLENKRDDISALAAYHLAIKNNNSLSVKVEQSLPDPNVDIATEAALIETNEQPETGTKVQHSISKDDQDNPIEVQVNQDQLAETQVQSVAKTTTISDGKSTTRRRSTTPVKAKNTTAPVKRPRTKKTTAETQPTTATKPTKQTKKTDGNA